MVGTWRRYSWRAVSRPAKPRCQPSIMASENAHAHDVAHVVNVRTRHGNRCATAGPHSTAATPMRIAGSGAPPDVGVPPAEDRRGVGEVAESCGVWLDQRRDDAQVQVRNHERRHHQDDGDGDRHRLPATDLQRAHPGQPRCRPLSV